jgi:hypothetical protein
VNLPLTRRQIIEAARKIKYAPLVVPELGGTIYVRRLPRAAGKVDLRHFRSELAARLIVDANGKRLLMNADAEILDRLPAGVLDRILARAVEFSNPAYREKLPIHDPTDPARPFRSAIEARIERDKQVALASTVREKSALIAANVEATRRERQLAVLVRDGRDGRRMKADRRRGSETARRNRLPKIARFIKRFEELLTEHRTQTKAAKAYALRYRSRDWHAWDESQQRRFIEALTRHYRHHRKK